MSDLDFAVHPESSVLLITIPYDRAHAAQPPASCAPCCIPASRPRTDAEAATHLKQLGHGCELRGLLLGDSLMSRFCGEKSRRPMKQLWGKLQQFGGLFNAGVGGDCIEHVLHRVANTPLIERMPELRCVILMAGTNNIMKSFWRRPADQLAQGVMGVVDAVRARCAGVRVVVLAVPPGGVFEPKLEGCRREFNHLLGLQVAAASLDGVRFVDFTGELLKDGTHNRALFQDSVHFNKDGYEWFARKLSEILEQELGVSR